MLTPMIADNRRPGCAGVALPSLFTSRLNGLQRRQIVTKRSQMTEPRGSSRSRGRRKNLHVIAMNSTDFVTR